MYSLFISVGDLEIEINFIELYFYRFGPPLASVELQQITIPQEEFLSFPNPKEMFSR